MVERPKFPVILFLYIFLGYIQLKLFTSLRSGIWMFCMQIGTRGYVKLLTFRKSRCTQFYRILR